MNQRERLLWTIRAQLLLPKRHSQRSVVIVVHNLLLLLEDSIGSTAIDPNSLEVGISVQRRGCRRYKLSVRAERTRVIECSGVVFCCCVFCVGTGSGALELALWRRETVLGS